MPEQVSECPYCGETFPHQGPTGCPPIEWPPPAPRSMSLARKLSEDEPCIHPGVFATKNANGEGPDTEYCGRCGRDVPYTEL
jgi:hypothetical protein